MMIESFCRQCGWVGLDGASRFCDWRTHWFGFLICLTFSLDLMALAVWIPFLFDCLALVVEAVVLIIVACGWVGEASFGVEGLALATIATVFNGFSDLATATFPINGLIEFYERITLINMNFVSFEVSCHHD